MVTPRATCPERYIKWTRGGEMWTRGDRVHDTTPATNATSSPYPRQRRHVVDALTLTMRSTAARGGAGAGTAGRWASPPSDAGPTSPAGGTPRWQTGSGSTTAAAAVWDAARSSVGGAHSCGGGGSSSGSVGGGGGGDAGHGGGGRPRNRAGRFVARPGQVRPDGSAAPRLCAACGTDVTTQWRTGLRPTESLCNGKEQGMGGCFRMVTAPSFFCVAMTTADAVAAEGGQNRGGRERERRASTPVAPTSV